MSSTYVLSGCIVVPPATSNPVFLQIVGNSLPALATHKTEEEATRNNFAYVVYDLENTIDENKWSPH